MPDETKADTALERRVAAHYTGLERTRVILDALRAAGKDPDRLTIEDLAPVDEFHIRGREATVELGHALGLRAEQRVLDVGSGIGGASRYFAATYGVHVTGIDLTPEYCRLAAHFARSTGLADRLEYRHGSALALPFATATFDVAYTQHVAMNIPDKPALYAEIARVLKPGAAFGVYDVMQGSGGEVIYPTPWADDGLTSFLATPDEMRRLLEAAGFRIRSWRDRTVAGRTFFETVLARTAAGGPPRLGLHLLLPDFRRRGENMLRGLAEDRLAVIEIVCHKV